MIRTTQPELPDNMVSFNHYLNDVASNSNYQYGISSGYTIFQQGLNPDGTPKVRQGNNNKYSIGGLLYFAHDLEHECSFTISENRFSNKKTTTKVYFENIDNHHAKQAFRSIMKHFRLINEKTDLKNKSNPIYRNLDFFEVCPVYVFDALHQIIYQKMVFKFKAYKQFKETYVIVKNNDASLEDGIKAIDNEFFIRYYSQLIEKKDMTEKLTKSEKQIVKMYYY